MLLLLLFNRWQMLLCMQAKSLQSCLILCDPMDRSLPDFSVHGIFWPRILEWVVTFSKDPLLYILSLVSALDSPYSSKIPLDTSAEFFPEN